MKIDRKSGTPLYIQISEYMKENIEGGRWKKGDQLPSENELVSELKVSRGTLKKALNELVEEGLIEQIQGKGTYVKGDDIQYSLGSGLLSFAESLESQSINYKTELLHKEYRKATKEIANKLKIPKDSEYLYLLRLRYVEDEKIMLIENRLNHRLANGIENIDFNKYNLFNTIENLSGLKISYSESKYAAERVGERKSKFLEVDKNDPILRLNQLVFLENDNPVEYGDVWLKSNKYYVSTILQRRNE